MARKKSKEKPSGEKQFRNRRAFYEFHFDEKIECGIVLSGSEVKSIRAGKIDLADSYARIVDGEVFLLKCHISEYKNATHFTHEPVRQRKLLLHRREITKLQRKVDSKGYTLIPLRVYFNQRGLAKVELGLGRGKKLHDKRAALKDKDSQREVRRELSRY